MKKLEVYDPPMCCSTGICGSNANPTLVVFASDLEWLKTQGIEVIRYGISLNPTEFSKNNTVKTLIEKQGNACLPILFFDGKITYNGSYPTRGELADMCKVGYNNDEAPPVHREENCCCGIDCDCNIPQHKKTSESFLKCNCANAAAEDNCFCSENYDIEKTSNINKIIRIISIIIILILLAFFGLKINSTNNSIDIKLSQTTN